MSFSKAINIDPSWTAQLADEFLKPYWHELWQFLHEEKQAQKIIYPPENMIFNALNLTPFNKVKVVILGQDPYHGPRQAHGLAFSVLPKEKIPPSLLNIYKELHHDLPIEPVSHGCLHSWATQGVLLLNTVLTVEHGLPGSHQDKGWEHFTDHIIAQLNARNEPVIFVLWGNHAHRKADLIDQTKHTILASAHPSPLSAYRGFFGNKHFSTINKILISQGDLPINWQLPKKMSL